MAIATKTLDVGEGGAVVFGSLTDPQIAVVSDTKTGGTYVQLIRAAQYDGRKANLGGLGPDQAYSGTAPLAGEEPRLATGPSGTFLMSRPAFGKGYEIRDLTPGRAAKPVPASPPAVSRDLVQDPSGRLIAGWVERGKNEVVARTSGNGSSFSRPPDALQGRGRTGEARPRCGG